MSYLRKKSKYSAIKTPCRQGHNHDSRLEARYCNDLMILQMAGEIVRYDVQIKFPLEVRGVHICDHIVDFVIIGKDKNGKINIHPEVHDTKGARTAVFNLKYKLFQVLYPQIKYYIVKKGELRWQIKRGSRRRTKTPGLPGKI